MGIIYDLQLRELGDTEAKVKVLWDCGWEWKGGYTVSLSKTKKGWVILRKSDDWEK